MRKITKEAVAAFMDGRDRSMGNTYVVKYDNGHYIEMFLHGNNIARRMGKKIEVRTCGYATRTTMERLNGIPGVSVYQKKFQLYLNGKIWENHSDWTEVKP